MTDDELKALVAGLAVAQKVTDEQMKSMKLGLAITPFFWGVDRQHCTERATGYVTPLQCLTVLQNV